MEQCSTYTPNLKHCKQLCALHIMKVVLASEGVQSKFTSNPMVTFRLLFDFNDSIRSIAEEFTNLHCVSQNLED